MGTINIIGASGHGKVIIEIAEANNITINKVYDQHPNANGLLGYSIFPQSEIINTGNPYVIAVGNNVVRKQLSETLSVEFATLIHPSANISKRASIGTGSVIMAGVSVNSDVQIGVHVIINTNASVDHDCEIEDYVHISPNVGLAGNVKVGLGAHVGIGANIIQGKTIGKWATVGAGAVVINDVPDYAVVVGNPAKIIKYNKEVL